MLEYILLPKPIIIAEGVLDKLFLIIGIIDEWVALITLFDRELQILIGIFC